MIKAFLWLGTLEDFTVSYKECASPKVGGGCQFDSLEQEKQNMSLFLQQWHYLLSA